MRFQFPPCRAALGGRLAGAVSRSWPTAPGRAPGLADSRASHLAATRDQISNITGTFRFPSVRERMRKGPDALRPLLPGQSAHSGNETQLRANHKLFKAALSGWASRCYLAVQFPSAAGTGHGKRSFLLLTLQPPIQAMLAPNSLRLHGGKLLLGWGEAFLR